jgi:hypothetical protein
MFIKRTGIILILFVLLTSTVIGTLVVMSPRQNLSGAKTYSTITILSDGAVEGTDRIQRNGNVYTFTCDIFGTITVKRANIIIDGAGYALQGNGDMRNSKGIILYPFDSDGNNVCNGILVKNVRFYDMFEAIYTSSSNNSFINNSFDGARIHIIGASSNIGNVVKYNIFTNAGIFVDYWSGTNEVITENNFINSHIFVDLAYPPMVDKNYWSSYTTAHPNAKERDNSGIWDTPYNYDVTESSHGSTPCIDYNPLVTPVDNAGAPKIISTQTLTAHIAITLLVVLIVSPSLLIYIKKRKQSNVGDSTDIHRRNGFFIPTADRFVFDFSFLWLSTVKNHSNTRFQIYNFYTAS